MAIFSDFVTTHTNIKVLVLINHSLLLNACGDPQANKIVFLLQKNQLLDDIQHKGVGVHFLFNYNHLRGSLAYKF